MNDAVANARRVFDAVMTGQFAQVSHSIRELEASGSSADRAWIIALRAAMHALTGEGDRPSVSELSGLDAADANVSEPARRASECLGLMALASLDNRELRSVAEEHDRVSDGSDRLGPAM